MDLEHIDEEMLSSLTQLMGGKFGYVVDLFEAEGRKYLNNMRDACLSDDAETLRDAAHTLKSSSANYGLKRVNHISLTIESEMRNCIETQVGWRHVQDYITELEEAFAQGVLILKTHENYSA